MLLVGQLMLLVGLSLLLREVTCCPCSYSSDLREVTCEPNTQDLLPFYLPDCLGQFVDSTQVERLVLREQNFPEVVSNAFSLFPNMMHLDLSYCQIDVIDQHVLEYNKKLYHIILTGNNLSDLPSLFPSRDNSLQSLTASHNQIQSVNATLLENLLFIELDYNLLTKNEITNFLSFLPNILEASLESNLIESIDKTTLVNLAKLRVVSFWNNKISYIEPGSFDHLLSLHYLDVTNNPANLITESWHLCHELKGKNLHVKGPVMQDLKVDTYTDEYCEAAQTSNGIEDFCTNDDGHLTCTGSIEDLVCELKKITFKSIIFQFPKDINTVEVDNFYEAETNIFFQDMNQINGKSNMTKYLKDLKLYGTKFDLSTLDSYVGLRTETVTVFADTVYMKKAIQNPITFKLNIRARVVSISENISMNMTSKQFFKTLESDQPVDNWAMVHEIITGVGNTSFSVKKLGFVEVQKATDIGLIDPNLDTCVPRIFSVKEYETEHKTAPNVFFNGVQINLLRMAVRTLASTRTNDALAMTMANHLIKKTTNPAIVSDKNAYIVAQKVIRDIEILNSNTKNIPFYSTEDMKSLVNVMYLEMSNYASNESKLILNLDTALERMSEINKNFEDARMTRELYFEEELKTLEDIWNHMDDAWHWSFNASRNMENSIQDSINKNGEEMFQMGENDLKEILARAEKTVDSSRAVVENFKLEIKRYSVEATMSYKLQRKQLNETNKMAETVKEELKKFDDQITPWKGRQVLQACLGFVLAFGAVAAGMATFQPEIAIAGVAAGVDIATAAGAAEAARIATVLGAIIQLITASEALEKMLDSVFEDMNVDVNISGDMALGAALNWHGALENAYQMKESTSKFKEVDTLGKTEVESVGTATDGDVNPTDLQQTMTMYASKGGQLIQETVNFAKLMMHLADLAGELKVAETDLEIAIEQVNRAIEMHVTLAYQHKLYVEWNIKHRDNYQDKCDEFAEEFDTASTESKEESKKEITALFESFKKAFEDSNDVYVDKMNDLTTSLYAKVAGVKQQSMTQRSMIINVYQDFCDGLFYFSFTSCDSTNHYNDKVPTMSDSFGDLLEKLNGLKWDLITSLLNFHGTVEHVHKVVVNLVDSHITGFDTGKMFGPVTQFREERQVVFNLKDYTSYFDRERFYRIRLDKITVHLYDKEDELIPSPEASADGAHKFSVYFPLEFNDTNVNDELFSFRAVKKTCAADYWTSKGTANQMSACAMTQVFDGSSHRVSHDGIFKVIAIDMDQSILDQVAKIQVTVGGSYVER